MDLPPMLRQPGPETRRRWETAGADAARRSANDNRAAYRAAVLEHLAQLLEDEPVGGVTMAEAHGLTYDQAQRAQNAMAKVLRHRAETGGRIRI